MADDEQDNTIAEDGNSISKINQLLKIIPPCCNLNCKSLSKESDDKTNETEDIPQGNGEEPNHEMQGMLIYLNSFYIRQKGMWFNHEY